MQETINQRSNILRLQLEGEYTTLRKVLVILSELSNKLNFKVKRIE